jgi:hypothetical protein
VDVEVTLEKGAAEPFQLTVPAKERITLEESKEPRIPKEDPFVLNVIRRSGPEVVVERTIDAVAPAPRTGFADTIASRRVSRRWFLASGSVSPTVDEWVVVHNPGRSPVRVSFAVLAGGQRLAVDGLQDVALGAGRFAAYRIGDHLQRPQTPMVVDATGPVVVERSTYRNGAIGFSISYGIPAP